MSPWWLCIWLLVDYFYNFGESSCVATIDGCEKMPKNGFYYLHTYRFVKLKVVFSSAECFRNNYSYSWKVTQEPSKELFTAETKVPVWDLKYDVRREDEYHVVFVSLKNSDKADEKPISTTCRYNMRPKPNQLHLDVRTLSTRRSTYYPYIFGGGWYKNRTYHYQIMEARYCSISTPEKSAWFLYERKEPVSRLNSDFDHSEGDGWYARYLRDMTRRTEVIKMEVRMRQIGRYDIVRNYRLDMFYDSRDVDYYPENTEQFLHNEYCVKNCACPRREYAIDTNIHIVASVATSEIYKNYTYLPKRRVEHYMFLPVLAEARQPKNIFAEYKCFYVYILTTWGRPYSAFLIQENTFIGTYIDCTDPPTGNLKAIVDVVSFGCHVQISHYSLKYRISQHLGDVIMTLSEMDIPRASVRLAANPETPWVYVTLLTPSNSLQKHVYTTKVTPYMEDMKNYEEVIKKVSEIFSDNDPAIISPQRLFHLNLFDDAVALMNGILREIILYQAKGEKDLIKKADHLRIFAGECIDLLMKFEEKKAALHARITIIPSLIHAPTELEYRIKVSRYCINLVKERIGSVDVFAKGAHTEIEGFIYEDFDQEYKIIRRCAQFIASSEEFKADRGTPKKRSERFHLHPVADPRVELDEKQDVSELEKIHMKLVEIYYNYREMIYQMSSVRIKECFFCNVDDEIGTGHLLYSIVTYEPWKRHLATQTRNSKSVSYKLYAHEFDYSLYGTLVNLIVPIQPSRLYVYDKKDSFLFSSIATIYAILVRNNNGKQEVLKIGRIDVMFPRVRHPIELSLFKSELILFPPIILPRNSTDYLILEVDAITGKSTCLEIHNATKPLTMHVSTMEMPEIGYAGINIPVGKQYMHCFPVATADARYFFGLKHEREHLTIGKKPKLKPTAEEFKIANFTYVGYALACARLINKAVWTMDDTLDTDNNLLRCSGSTIEDVAVLATPTPVKLHYPSYHFAYKYVHGFDLEINLLMYVPVLIAVALYCILWIFLLCRSLHPQAVYFLSDNHKDERYAYMIEVTTGKESGAGTTSNIIIKVFGRTGNSRAHVLNYPDPNLRLLRNNSQNYFIMTTGRHLGDLKHIQLWSDFISIQPRWKCDQIRICDLQTKHWWAFNVNSWLTLDERNYHCIKTHATRRRTKKPPTYEIFLPYFNANHTWNVISSFSRFYTCAEKATMVLSHILCLCSATMLVCINPKLQSSDARELLQVTDDYVAGVTFQISIIAFAVNVPFVLLFRSSEFTRKELYIYKPNLFSRTVRWITWFFLGVLIIVNVLNVFIYSLYISYNTSLKMIGFIVISLLWIIFIWEFLFIIILNAVNQIKSEVDIRKYFYNRIVAEGEKQRAMIARIYENSANMRPYLIHLYKPLGADVLTIKRRIVARIQFVGKYLRYILFLIAYILLLHLLTVANRDKLMPVHNEHVKNMVIGESPAKQENYTILTDISSLAAVRPYIGEILLESLHSKVWYGNYQVADPHLLTDFQTKYFGKLSLRLVAVRGVSAPGGKIAKNIANTTKIYPEFTKSREDKYNRSDSLSEWSYYAAEDSGRLTFRGELTEYPGGGFIKILAHTAEEYRNETKQRERKWWLEDSARAICIEFLTYNNNLNVFSAVRVLIEKSATGLTIASISVISQRLNYRGQITTLLTRIAIYLLIGITTLYFLITIRNIIITKSFWLNVRILDAVVFFGTICVIIFFAKRNFVADTLFPKLKFEHEDKIIKYFHAFAATQTFDVVVGFTLWLLIIGICLYLKFVTSDVAVHNLLLSWQFLGLILTYLIFAACFSIVGHILYSQSKHFQSFSVVFRNILLLRCLRKTDTYEIMGYSHQTFPVFTAIFAVLLFYIMAMYVAHFNRNYTEGKRYAKFFWFNRYSAWNYFTDNVSFYREYVCRRMEGLKLAGGKSRECDRIYFRANEHRFCGCFSTKESELEAIRYIVFGHLYIKYLREDRPLNYADLGLMLGIAESYMKRNDSVDMVYYKDCRPGTRHYMTERRIALMDVVIDRMLQRKRLRRRRSPEGEKDESISDTRTIRRLDSLIFQLNALNDTLECLLDY